VNESFSNYFNYFTEIEEHFQKARGTSLFLLSPLDWALIETWKNSGIPLEAVLRGIDAAFEKWRARRSRLQMVNSIAYCTQAVVAEAQRMADAGSSASTGRAEPKAPFSKAEIERYIVENAASVRHAGAGFEAIAEALEQIAAEFATAELELESLEQRLTALEQKMVATAKARQTDGEATEARRSLDQQLKPYRGKMTAAQIVMLEQQFLDRNVLDRLGLPRLSMFYLR
jgi:chromosome segregation ATPase